MADQWPAAATGGGVVVWPVGNERARHCGASPGGTGSVDHRTSTTGLKYTRRRSRCCSRCHLPPPTSCAEPRAGWPTG